MTLPFFKSHGDWRFGSGGLNSSRTNLPNTWEKPSNFFVTTHVAGTIGAGLSLVIGNPFATTARLPLRIANLWRCLLQSGERERRRLLCMLMRALPRPLPFLASLLIFGIWQWLVSHAFSQNLAAKRKEDCQIRNLACPQTSKSTSCPFHFHLKVRLGTHLDRPACCCLAL